ncbi:MAG: hypothetical protein HOO97_02900 [Sideroxydans sp.]|nr:hypothetical protein [Sideroxydans sp.]NOT98029.1 hypothetical protein [Sideroxydans sp.]
MSNPPEFAELYTTAERIKFIVMYIVIGGALITASKLFFFPWLKQFSSTAQCQTIVGVNGLVLLWYGIFIGIPLLAGILVASFQGCRGYKVLRDEQAPPIGEKVFKPTRIVRGTKAKIIGYLQLFSFTPFLAFSIWGGLQAHTMSVAAHNKSYDCTNKQTHEMRDNKTTLLSAKFQRVGITYGT